MTLGNLRGPGLANASPRFQRAPVPTARARRRGHALKMADDAFLHGSVRPPGFSEILKSYPWAASAPCLALASRRAPPKTVASLRPHAFLRPCPLMLLQGLSPQRCDSQRFAPFRGKRPKLVGTPATLRASRGEGAVIKRMQKQLQKAEFVRLFLPFFVPATAICVDLS